MLLSKYTNDAGVGFASIIIEYFCVDVQIQTVSNITVRI